MLLLAKFEWERATDTVACGTCDLVANDAGGEMVFGTGGRVPSVVAAAVRFMYVHADSVDSEMTLDGYTVRFTARPKRPIKIKSGVDK